MDESNHYYVMYVRLMKMKLKNKMKESVMLRTNQGRKFGDCRDWCRGEL